MTYYPGHDPIDQLDYVFANFDGTVIRASENILRNGNILADSGEGYSDRSGAWEAIEGVKRNAPNAGLEGS